jgi:hypothetical protein
MQPSNAQVKAIYKNIVLDAFKKRGYSKDKYPHCYSICMTKKNEEIVIKVEATQKSWGEVELYMPGVFFIPVESHLVEATRNLPIHNTKYGSWEYSTFQIPSIWKEMPKPPSRAFESIEEAETMFRTYVAYMEATGFGLIDYYSSIENMNEELQKTHDIPAAPGILWRAFGMAGVARYYRGLIIAKLCNKHFDERLEKIYRELNYFIHEYPDPKFNESSKDTLAEFETVLPYIHQIQPIYHL